MLIADSADSALSCPELYGTSLKECNTQTTLTIGSEGTPKP